MNILLLLSPQIKSNHPVGLRVNKPGITDKTINPTKVVFIISKPANAVISSPVSSNSCLLLYQNTKFLEHQNMTTFYREYEREDMTEAFVLQKLVLSDYICIFDNRYLSRYKFQARRDFYTVEVICAANWNKMI